MRIWRIEAAPSNKDEIYWKRYPRELIGKPYQEIVFEPEWRNDLRPRRCLRADTYRFDTDFLTLSDRAHGCLADLLEFCAESVRVVVEGQVVWVEKVIDVVDCLGSATVMDCVTYSDGSRYIRHVFQYDIIREALPDADLFGIVGQEGAPFYCTDAFVRRAAECDLEGFRFVLVWDSSLPLGAVRFEWSDRLPDYYLDSGKRGRACLPCGSTESFGKKLVVPDTAAPAAGVASAMPEKGQAGASGELEAPVAPESTEDGLSAESHASSAAHYDGPPLDADILAARAAALASLPDLPALGGALSDGPCAPLGSRVGGEPAMLPGEEWPLGPGGVPLCFLAQLDMADLSALPGFPRRGLLRLFVGPEPEYGLDPGDMTAQLGFRALFAPDATGALPRPAPEEAEDGLAWGEGPWAVRFGALAPMPPDDFDVRLQEAFSREWAGLHPGLPAGSISGADRYASGVSLSLDVAIAAEEAAEDPPTVQVGGWPSFIQADDRRSWEERYERYDALLLQLSSDPDRWINIGDGGRMYFFIPSANLAAGDFSDVMYWWDGM